MVENLRNVGNRKMQTSLLFPKCLKMDSETMRIFVRGSELTQEENQRTDKMDFGISEKEKRKLEYLEVLQAFRE